MSKQYIFEAMDFFKNNIRPNNKILYGGIDEVGVSSIAGPMTCAIVVLPEHCDISVEHKGASVTLPYDSKLLDAQAIQKLSKVIYEKAVYIRMFYIQAKMVDELGTDKAIGKLWDKTAKALRTHSPFAKIILDGKRGILHLKNHKAVVGADSMYINVSAAAIVAKAWTDNWLIDRDREFPKYNLKQNKGYPTREHLEVIRMYGLTDVHRPTMAQSLLDKGIPIEIMHFKDEEVVSMLKDSESMINFDKRVANEWEIGFVLQMVGAVKRNQRLSARQQYFVYKTHESILKRAKRLPVTLG